jgi:hypothetical protein
VWDAATNSLLITPISTPQSPATVTVRWEAGATPITDLVYKSFVLTTNAKGTDAPYLIENSAAADASSRICDKSGLLIWKFDISEYDGLLISAAIVNNYILEISGDNDDYDRVADFSKVSIARAQGNNQAVCTIITDAHESVKDTIYIRLRNTNAAMGWGGSISSLTFRYLVTP